MKMFQKTFVLTLCLVAVLFAQNLENKRIIFQFTESLGKEADVAPQIPKQIIRVDKDNAMLKTPGLSLSSDGLSVTKTSETVKIVSEPIALEMENTKPFISVGFKATFKSDLPNAVIHFRSSADGKNWTDWQFVEEQDLDVMRTRNFASELMFLTSDSRYIQYSIEFQQRSDRNFDTLVEMELFLSCPGETPESILNKINNSSDGGLKKAIIGAKALGMPTYTPRSDWGSYYSLTNTNSSRVTTTVQQLVLHHSAANTTSSDFAAVVRAYWNYHVNSNGWADIGYNWLTDPNGVLYQGRAFKYATTYNIKGAHNTGLNSHTLGFCIIGNYETYTPSTVSLETTANIMAYFCDLYDLDPTGTDYMYHLSATEDVIDGHKQSGGTYGSYTTSCPGQNLISYLSQLRTDVDNVVNGTVATPTQIEVFNNGANSIKVECSTVSGADSYEVAYGTDGSNFPNTQTSTSNEITITGLSSLTTYYVKVRAIDGIVYSDWTSQSFAAVTSSYPYDILVVNGFDRSSNTLKNYITKFTSPIQSAGRGFSYVQNESVINSSVSLNDYNIVVWFLGNESTADETFSSTEQSLVQSYLQQGGQLFVSGAEIGWDLDYKGSTSDKAFYNNYLKADYMADSPGGTSATYYTATKVSGSVFDDLTSDVVFDDGTYTIDVKYADAIAPVNGSESCMTYKNASSPNIAAISYSGTFPSGTSAGKLVYLGFPFETITTQTNRTSVMAAVLSFMNDPTQKMIPTTPPTFDVTENAVPEKFELMPAYPNPFNPTTQINYNLPASSKTIMTVYDMRGNKIRTLVNGNMDAGYHSVQWNGKDDKGKLVPAGIYLYQLQAGSAIRTRKMTFVK